MAILDRPAPRQARRKATNRLARGLPSLAGLALIAVLLSARESWAAGIVLLALTFTVPGVLLLRALRVPGRAVRAYPLFVVAGSLAVMLAAGLGADLIGPLAGIPEPLHGHTTALATLGASLVLWAAGLPAPAAARLPWRRALESPASLAPLALPLVSAAGALLLSHGHGPTVARAGQGLTALVLLGGLLLAPRLRRGQVAMLLFGCALAAEWAFSLRSQEVVGFDITTELGIAQHTFATGLWKPRHVNDAYGAMLSVTVLPSVLRSLTGCSPLIAFKVVYPVLTALLPVTIFLLGERVMRRGYAAAAAALLIVQSYFFGQLSQLARQEVALVFFAALVAALVDGRMRRGPRLCLIAVLCAGLVVSHYSSTYLAIPIVLIALAVSVLAVRRRATGLVTPLLCAAVVLVGGAGAWYVGITQSGSNLSSFFSSLQHNGLNLLPNSNGNIISSYLNGNNTRQVSARAYQRLAVRQYRARTGYIHPLPAAHQKRFDLRPATVPVPKARLALLSSILQWVSIAFAELMLGFGVLGALIMAVRRRGPPAARRIGVLALGTVAILVLIRFSGTVASQYNQSRALAQALVLLAVPAAWLVQHALDRFGRVAVSVTRRVRLVAAAAARLPVATAAVLALSFPIMLAFDSSLTSWLVGGETLLNLSNRGEDYQRQYMTPAELAGATWAAKRSRARLLYADPYGQLRLNASTGGTATALLQVTPLTLDRHAWLYGTHSNLDLGTTRGKAYGATAVYAWPSRFLHSYYDTMYSDGDSRVYHR